MCTAKTLLTSAYSNSPRCYCKINRQKISIKILGCVERKNADWPYRQSVFLKNFAILSFWNSLGQDYFTYDKIF